MKRWLSLKEACEYTHVGKDRLKELARKGVVRGFQDPDCKGKYWIFDRESLDAYREGQMTRPVAREKALAIMKGVKI